MSGEVCSVQRDCKRVEKKKIESAKEEEQGISKNKRLWQDVLFIVVRKRRLQMILPCVEVDEER